MDTNADESVVYLAANGHRMEVGRGDYDRGRTWAAQHSVECECGGLESPPDW